MIMIKRLIHPVVFGTISSLLIAFASVVSGEQAKWDVDQLLQKLSQVQFAQLKFVEKKQSIFLTGAMELSGEMVYRAPDYMEKITTDPFSEKVLIEGDVITIERVKTSGKKGDEKKEVQRHSIASHFLLNSAVGSIRAILAGEIDILKENYDIQMSGDESWWNLVLMPRVEKIKEQVEQISLAGSGVEIREIATKQPDGDENSLTLSYQTIR